MSDDLISRAAAIAAVAPALRSMISRGHAVEIIAAIPAQPTQEEAVAPKCWWIDHGNYGQITMREDEATTAHSEGKRVIVYHPTPPASAELDALVAEARERARDEFAAGHMNDAVFHGNVADAIVGANCSHLIQETRDKLKGENA